MKKILLVFFTAIFCQARSQTQILQWAKQLSGYNLTTVNPVKLTVDKNGNVYSVGKYKGVADFNPGTGTFTLPANAYENAYISKLDAQGNFLWASAFYDVSSTPFTPVANSVANSVALDTVGNVFTTGQFLGTIDFDPGPSNFSLSSGTQTAIFVSKLDAKGNFIWAKKIGGALGDLGSDIAVSKNGSCHIVGTFSNKIFVAKLDPLGGITWSVNLGGAGGRGRAITLDNNGTIFTTGLGVSGDYDPGPGTFSLNAASLSASAVFISKLSPGGNFVWAGLQSGTSINNQGIDIEIDSASNMFILDDVAPQLQGYVTDMDPGPGTYTIAHTGSRNLAVSKLDSNGNFLWAKSISPQVTSTAMALDRSSNVYICGEFAATIDFDPGLGNYTLVPAASVTAFFLTLSSTGNFVHVQKDSSYLPLSITIHNKYVYATGVLFELVAQGNFTLTQTGSTDGFVLKKITCYPGASVTVLSNKTITCIGEPAILTGLGAVTYTWIPGGNFASINVSPTITTTYTLNTNDADGCFGSVNFTQQVFDCTSIKDHTTLLNPATIYPNPTNGTFSFDLPEACEITLVDLLGRILYTQLCDAGMNTISLLHVPRGIYTVTAAPSSNTSTYRIIVND